MRLKIFAILIIFITSIAFIAWLLKPNSKQLVNSNSDYQYDLAVMNKSFKRDLERSVIAFKSFEKHFLGVEKVPFVVVIPSGDWDLFMERFQELRSKQEIKNIPTFITEQEVLERCGEPYFPQDGNLTQQVVKLCFGSTKIARNYIMMDSDNYFTKDFDPQILFKKGVLKTIAWKLPESQIEANKKTLLGCCADPMKRNEGTTITADNMINLIKDFFGNKNPDAYGFVLSPFLFNSDALDRIKKFIAKKGGYKITHLIRLIPFEMQWYGEYMLQYENFVQGRPIFTLVSSPEECHPAVPKDYGFWFQSVIYDYKGNREMRDNDQFIYKRPAHCDR